MKEIKEFGKSYIFLSAVYVVLGVVMIAWPAKSIQMIYYGLGFAMIVIGISYGVIYFTKEQKQGFLQMDLVIGIVSLAFGIFILFNSDFFRTVLPFAMGIILLLGVVVKLQNAVNMKRMRFEKWYIVLILSLVLAAMGVVLLCNPFPKEKYMILYIGICLILDGLTNLISMILIQLRVKQLKRYQKENPDASWGDLIASKEQKAVDRVRYAASTQVNDYVDYEEPDACDNASGAQVTELPASYQQESKREQE